MMEARTFSPGDPGADGTCLIGRCTEVSLGCSDPTATRAFFEQAGFLGAEEDAPGVTWLDTPGIRLGLRPVAKLPTLRFATTAPALRQLQSSGFHLVRTSEGHALEAPEGTRLVLF
jgi:hypothetical protein